MNVNRSHILLSKLLVLPLSNYCLMQNNSSPNACKKTFLTFHHSGNLKAVDSKLNGAGSASNLFKRAKNSPFVFHFAKDKESQKENTVHCSKQNDKQLGIFSSRKRNYGVIHMKNTYILSQWLLQFRNSCVKWNRYANFYCFILENISLIT